MKSPQNLSHLSIWTNSPGDREWPSFPSSSLLASVASSQPLRMESSSQGRLTTTVRVCQSKLVAGFQKLKFRKLSKMKLRGENSLESLRSSIIRCSCGKTSLKQEEGVNRKVLEVYLDDTLPIIQSRPSRDPVWSNLPYALSLGTKMMEP